MRLLNHRPMRLPLLHVREGNILRAAAVINFQLHANVCPAEGPRNIQ
jgi:hypothetical protein